jgi:hypothetical protein
MKKVFIFLLSLTCLAAHAQYNKSHASKASQSSPLLSYYGIPKTDLIPKAYPEVRVPMFTTLPVTSTQTNFNSYNAPALTTSSQGYWSGKSISTTSQNGRFQNVQTYDINGNLKESKATFQFSTRKKR